MNKYLFPLMGLTLTFIGVVPFDNKWQIVKQLDEGKLKPQVYDHQVDHDSNRKQIPTEYADRKTEVNMREMRMFKTQVGCAKSDLAATGCKGVQPQLQSAKAGS